MSAHLDFLTRYGKFWVWCRGVWSEVIDRKTCYYCGQDISHRLTKQHLSGQDSPVAGSARRRYTPTPAPHVPPQTVPRGGFVVQEDK